MLAKKIALMVLARTLVSQLISISKPFDFVDNYEISINEIDVSYTLQLTANGLRTVVGVVALLLVGMGSKLELEALKRKLPMVERTALEIK